MLQHKNYLLKKILLVPLIRHDTVGDNSEYSCIRQAVVKDYNENYTALTNKFIWNQQSQRCEYFDSWR